MVKPTQHLSSYRFTLYYFLQPQFPSYLRFCSIIVRKNISYIWILWSSLDFYCKFLLKNPISHILHFVKPHFFLYFKKTSYSPNISSKIGFSNKISNIKAIHPHYTMYNVPHVADTHMQIIYLKCQFALRANRITPRHSQTP